MKRRSFLSLLGVGAVTGPKLTADVAVNAMRGLSGSGLGVVAVGPSHDNLTDYAGIGSASSSSPDGAWTVRQLRKKLKRLLHRDGVPEWLKDSVRRDYAERSVRLDADLAVLVSVPLARKTIMQRERLVARAAARFGDPSPYQAREDWEREHFSSEDRYALGRLL